jgi:hypothetical protein
VQWKETVAVSSCWTLLDLCFVSPSCWVVLFVSALSVTDSRIDPALCVQVWGVCLGFELLCEYFAGGDFSVLSHFDAENISLPLRLEPGARSSRLLSLLTDGELQALQLYPLTENYRESFTDSIAEGDRTDASSANRRPLWCQRRGLG